MKLSNHTPEFTPVVIELTSQAEVNLVYAALRHNTINSAFGIPANDDSYELLEKYIPNPDAEFDKIRKFNK